MNLHEPVNATAYKLAGLAKRFALLPRSFMLTSLEINGVIPGKRFVYLGEGESLPYLRKLLSVSDDDLSAARIPLWRLWNEFRRSSSPDTLLCLELNRLLRPMVPAGGLLTYPWVRQRVYLNSREYGKYRWKIEKNGRKTRERKYRFRLVNDYESVESFYEELYLPYISARFGDTVHLRSHGEFKRWVGSGFLLQVFHGDIWVSGVVCRLRKGELSALALGHLPEERYSLSFGALSAAYYFLFQYAAEHSLDCLDLLRSKPHGDDGVFRHKRNWGARAEIDLWPHTAIWFFLPDGMTVPPPLERILVWDGTSFAEMGRSSRRQDMEG
jgi:hypothetical protein